MHRFFASELRARTHANRVSGIMRTVPCMPLATLAIAIAALVAGCRSTSQPAPTPGLPSITGTISLTGASSVPTGAMLVIRLVDMERSGSSRVIVEQLVSRPDTFPFRFRLFYNPSSIDFARDYGVEVSVVQSGRTLWQSTGPAPVLTKRRPEVVDIVLAKTE